jgi:uncharacterized protein (DUF1499 family)
MVRVAILMALFSCAGTPHEDRGLPRSRLAPCPASPNCVSSEATNPKHAIPPFHLIVAGKESWEAVRVAVLSLPRTKIITQTDNALHAECRSALFSFVDDLELRLTDSEATIAVRSASRTGYGDFGVNRRRVERLRAILVKRGLIR